MNVFIFREQEGNETHVHVNVWYGPEEGTRKKLGVLTFDRKEWKTLVGVTLFTSIGDLSGPRGPAVRFQSRDRVRGEGRS